jgi:hypothetical protein
MATAQFVGIAVRKSFLRQILVPDNVGWVIVQWVGTTWMITCGLAALIAAVDSGGRSSSSAGPIRDGVFARLVRSLHSTTPGVQRKGCFTLMGIIVASRLPYLVVYWPGIVQFDTFRSYSYARGTYQWESYEPVGSSLFVTATQWLGTFFGWGDAGGVAIGAMTLMLASCAAFTFMLLRMATWGVSRTVWVAALAWVTLLPVFGYFSIEIIKDMPFSVAMLVF